MDAVKCRVFRCKKYKPKEEYWRKDAEIESQTSPDIPFVKRRAFADRLSSMPRRRRRALERAEKKYQRGGYQSLHGTFQSFVKTELATAFEQTY